MTTLAGDAVYRHIEHLATGDPTSDVLLAGLAQAAGALVDNARRVALGTDTLRPGQLLWDASVAELWALPWTALLSGARLPPRRQNETADAYLLRARDAVIHVGGWRRGSPEAHRAIARGRLTGDRRVTVVERYQGSAWRTLVITYAAETPTPALTEADLKSDENVVAGVRLIYRTDLGWSIDQMEDAYAASDLDALEDDYPHIDALEDQLP